MLFLDTSFLAAYALTRDARPEAIRLADMHLEQQVVTTNLILSELWTLLRHRLGHRSTVEFLDRVHALPSLRLDRVSAAIEDESWNWLRQHDERPYSFVDATSFALMRKLRIRVALAFDGAFAAAGFVELRP
ncbi:MAG: type II toxin-antitoxin system VapC family toxin [Gaiellaceae bacterium]